MAKEQEQQETVTTVERARKRSPRKLKHKGKVKHPKASVLWSQKWADPVWRERQCAILRAKRLERKANNTLKSTSRFGIPDGMRREEAEKCWALARTHAEYTMAQLEQAGVLDDADDMAKEALQKALTVMRSPIAAREVLAAASLVLTYTKAKPATKSEITVNKAEEWLKQVTEDNEQAAD